VLITLQRHHRALGYFSAKRFQRRGQVRQQVHEVALNPDGFTGNTDEEILSTLAHEMVHVWQQEHGHPGRGRYHNREWARKMCSIGLMPSATGKPGGAVTGESVSHYIMEDGEFKSACGTFLNKYRLVWESAAVRANDNLGDGSRTGDEPRDNDDARAGGDIGDLSMVTRQTRTKLTCPNCGLNVWAKPNALVDCHQCSTEAQELVVMRANYARRAVKPEPISPGRFRLQRKRGSDDFGSRG
jgi:SprT-like family